MSVLLMRLAGPMQSWGTQSRFTERDTGYEPSKSGVIGLLCAALGRPREAEVADLADLEMGVRVDREGRLSRDFHTVGGGKWKGGSYGVAKASGSAGETAVSNRYYLADADFLVGWKGNGRLLEQIQFALGNPKWPLYLGRKSFVPSRPIKIQDGLTDFRDVETALREIRPETPLRLVLETTPDKGEPRRDVPLSFSQRRFGVRYVRMDYVLSEDSSGKEVQSCSFLGSS